MEHLQNKEDHRPDKDKKPYGKLHVKGEDCFIHLN